MFFTGIDDAWRNSWIHIRKLFTVSRSFKDQNNPSEYGAERANRRSITIKY